MTYRQAQELGGQVRKGESGSLVVFANRVTKTIASSSGNDGADVAREIPVMKGYAVFNVEQIDGLPERFKPRAAPPLQPHQAAEALFTTTRRSPS